MTAESDERFVDYYDVLDVSCDAEIAELKRAYRKLALKWHPDKHSSKDKDEATAKFRKITEAKDVLFAEERRRHFDHVRERYLRRKRREHMTQSSTVRTGMPSAETHEQKKKHPRKRAAATGPDNAEDAYVHRKHAKRQREAQKRQERKRSKERDARRARNDVHLESLYWSRVANKRERTLKVRPLGDAGTLPSEAKLRGDFEVYGCIESLIRGPKFALIVFRHREAASSAVWSEEYNVAWSVT